MTEQYRHLGYDVRLGVVPRHMPWCKAAAVEDALRNMPRTELRASGDRVLVVADADCWAPAIGQAVEVLASRARYGPKWAIPHNRVLRLDKASTARLTAAERAPVSQRDMASTMPGMTLAEPGYRGFSGGGIVALRLRDYLRVPLDHRFLGWGGEDESWGRALRTVYGFSWRQSEQPLWHLWHPPQQRMSRRHGSPESEALWEQYRSATLSKADMMALVNAGRSADRLTLSVLREDESL